MEMKTAAGKNNNGTNGPAENEEQNDQQATGESKQIEKGLGYGDPGEGSGETVSGNDSENAGAGIDYGGIGDDAGPITESTEEEPGN